MYRVTIFFAVFVLSVSGYSVPYSCSSANDCDCGYVCVGDNSLPCGEGPDCTCKLGCFVFDKFLEPSMELVEVYGNMCGCPDPVQSKGGVACTLLPWVGAPKEFEQIKNDNCDLQQPVQ